MKVVFRADATPAVGAGHLMRCWALAEEFDTRGWEIVWRSVIDVPWLATALARKSWQVERPTDIAADMGSHTQADLVVVDSYDMDYSYRESILQGGTPVVAIVDDHHPDLGPGSLWVNPGAPSLLSGGANFLNGPEFVLIREEIRALRRLRTETASPEGVTFLLGGTDHSNLTPIINNLEKDLLCDIGLDGPVVAGPISGSGLEFKGSVNWLPGGAELLRRAAGSRLVISAAGVSSWEMLHVGVPLGVLCTVDNQRGNYEWMTRKNWARGLGNGSNLGLELKLLPRDSLADSQRIDGLGTERVVKAALNLLEAR